ncbi:hypothetical protein ACQKWADRAFT_314070 [Trichoderma austrokoningii]
MILCGRCNVTYETEAAWDQHKIDSPYHYQCPKCYDLDCDTEEELMWHMIRDHHMCTTCNQCFPSSMSLDNHKPEHLAKPEKCYACPRTFQTKSAIILHLELGECKSGVQARHVNCCARDEQGAEWIIGGDGSYQCPECDRKFKFMSGLVQHAEGEACRNAMRHKNSPLAQFLRYLKTIIEQ